MVRDDCFSDTELLAFQRGELPEDALDAVADHLESCGRCDTAIQKLEQSGPDPVLRVLRNTRDTERKGDGNALSSLAPASLPLAPSPSPLTGTIGAYEILGQIGHGGMGIVYKARHTKLHRLVALKMLLGGEFVDEEQRRRFRTEAEAVARFQHANIVQIYDIGEYVPASGVPLPYLALEYVDGGNLHDQTQGRPQTPRQVAQWIEPLAHGVQYAHELGVLHRDIKPSNVLLTKTGVPKLCDFGLAKRLESWVEQTEGKSAEKTQTGGLMGTAEYMAPEQATGQSGIGPAADIYGLGALLYALLTGRPPFQAANRFETLNQVLFLDPVPPRRLQPTTPRDLETICLKCLQKEPSRRYRSAAYLADDLGRFLLGEPIHARPVSMWERGRKWCRKRPAWAALTLLVLLVLGVGVPLVTVLWLQADQALEVERRTASERDRALADERRVRDELEHTVYANRIAFADRALRSNDVATARALLDQCVPVSDRPDLRDWEWYYLMGQCRADLLPDLRHESEHWIGITSLGFEADDKWLFSASGMQPGPITGYVRNAQRQIAGDVRFWELAQGWSSEPWIDHKGAVWAAAISPDGRILASVGAEGTLCVRDLVTGSRSGPHAINDESAYIQFWPGTDRLVIVGTKKTQVWNLKQSRLEEVPQIQSWWSPIHFSADGKRVFAGIRDPGKSEHWNLADFRSAAGLQIWSLAEHKPITQLEKPGLWAVSPDENRVAVASRSANLIEVWDVGRASPALHASLIGHAGLIDALQFLPGGRLASGSADTTVRVWDTQRGAELYCFRGHRAGVIALASNRDGTRLLSGDASADIKIWDLTRDPRALTMTTGAREAFIDLAFTADSAKLRTVSPTADGQLALRDFSVARKGGRTSPLGIRPPGAEARHTFAFSGEGAFVAGVGINREELHVWRGNDGNVVGTFRVPGQMLRQVALNDRGDRVAFFTYRTPGRGNQPVVLSTIRVHSVPSSAQSSSGVTPPLLLDVNFDGRIVTALTISPDGRYLAAAWTEPERNKAGGLAITRLSSITIWDIDIGLELKTWPIDSAAIVGVLFAPQGDRLAVGGADGQLRLLDFGSGSDRFAPLRLPVTPAAMAFHPKGRRLAVTALDGRVFLLDAEAGHELLTLRCLGTPGTGQYDYRGRVAFSPDGRRLAANNWEGVVSIWDTVSAGQ